MDEGEPQSSTIEMKIKNKYKNTKKKKKYERDKYEFYLHALNLLEIVCPKV